MNINSKEELKELIKELIEECLREREIEKELNLLTEDNKNIDVKTVSKKLVPRFYEHTIKYRYNPEHQTQSWVNSIMQSVTMIRKILSSKSLYNDFIENYSNKMHDLFIDGANDCFCYNRYITIQDAENIYNEFDTIDKIIDINKVKDFCLKYAKNDNIRREVENKVKENVNN